MPALGGVFDIFVRLPKDLLRFCQGAPGQTRSTQHAGVLMVRGSIEQQSLTELSVLLSGVGLDEELPRQVRGRKGLQSECCVSVPIHNGSRLRIVPSRPRMHQALYRHNGLRVRRPREMPRCGGR